MLDRTRNNDYYEIYSNVPNDNNLEYQDFDYTDDAYERHLEEKVSEEIQNSTYIVGDRPRIIAIGVDSDEIRCVQRDCP